VHPSGHYSNLHFRNNILTGNTRECVTDDGGESQTGNSFDADLLYAGGYPYLFRWKGVSYPDLASLRAATGFEFLGRAGDPLFRAPEERDYALLPESPAIDGGMPLPGLNDWFVGAAPDMGAWEFEPGAASVEGGEHAGPNEFGDGNGSDNDDQEADAWHPSIGSLRILPNPSRDPVTIELSLLRPGRVETALFDVTGRAVATWPSPLLAPGTHRLRWDGLDLRGDRLPAGAYLLRLRCGGSSLTRRIVRLP
jgi:hypothetical protein